MESQRSFLLIALAVVTFLLFDAWQKDNAPVTPQIDAAGTVPAQVAQNSEDGFVPQANDSPEIASEDAPTVGKIISVKSDVLEVKIDTHGGDIVSAKLRQFSTELGNDIPFTILTQEGFTYVAQSGLVGAPGLDSKKNGRPTYRVSGDSFELVDGQDAVSVALEHTTSEGLKVVKTFTLKRDNYAIDMSYKVENNSQSTANIQLYGQLKQSANVESGSSMMMPTYRGAAYSSSEKNYEKYDFDDIADANLNVVTEAGWVAMLQHYFVSAWVPSASETNTLYTRQASGNQAVIGFISPQTEIQPGQTADLSAALFVGPKDQDRMESLAPYLNLTVDYGFLWMISLPLFWLLIMIQGVVGNWGLAIIVITLIVKGVMYPLTKAQYTSMAGMRKIQPKMAQLKERFGDDRQKMSQAMMELYKKEKVNPAGGCFPLLLQMPIFLALYWVFVESVELRHAPFALWITDLSAQDPYYVLPLLMGASMWLMQKMQPTMAQDPMQQKVMQWMPVMFTVFFLWFPSGLVLYWLVSNIITMTQMYFIFKGIDKKEALEKAAKKKS